LQAISQRACWNFATTLGSAYAGGDRPLHIRHDERADRGVFAAPPEAYMAMVVLTRLHLFTPKQVAGRDVKPARTRLHQLIASDREAIHVAAACQRIPGMRQRRERCLWPKIGCFGACGGTNILDDRPRIFASEIRVISPQAIAGFVQIRRATPVIICGNEDMHRTSFWIWPPDADALSRFSHPHQ